MRNWSFEKYIETIIALSEVAEVPDVAKERELLIREVWQKYPAECEMLGLTDGKGK